MSNRAKKTTAAGYQHLIETFGLTVKPLESPCRISRAAEKTTAQREGTEFPASKLTGSSLAAHLGIALKEEGVNLEVLHALFDAIPDRAYQEILRWNENCPHGSQARRAAYLFEWLTGRCLPLDGPGVGGHIDLVDPDIFVVSRNPVQCDRFRVNNNLIGTPYYCPTIRRTAKTDALATMDTKPVADAIRSLGQIEADRRLREEVHFSFLIEGAFGMMIEEKGYLEERLANLGKGNESAETELVVSRLAKLANRVSERPEARPTLRDTQNWIELRYSCSEEADVSYVPPSPDDLPTLFRHWVQWTRRQLNGTAMPPLMLAAVSSFGINYLHPFLDGNGRVHRYLLQALLVWSDTIPPGTVVPISPELYDNKWHYRNALSDFSDQVMLVLDYQLDTNAKKLNVTSPHPASLYQFWDATAVVELAHDAWMEATQVLHDLNEPH